MNDAKRFHVFVGNRVQQIRDQTSSEQWKYVSTKDNPADNASRGATASELVKSQWFSGPQFLWHNELPLSKDCSNMINLQNDPEVKRVQVFSASISTTKPNLVDKLSHFLHWDKVRRAVAIWMPLWKLLIAKLKGKHTATTSNIGKSLSVEDLRLAKVEIIRMLQADHFENDIEKLKQNAAISAESPLQQLDPFIDEHGLMRVGGRMRQSCDDFEVKHPVILPRSSHINQLLIQYFHGKVQHQGRGMTINELRSNGYWIIGCSAAVSSIIYYCVTRRKLRGRSQEQKMADLPHDRLDPAPPFSYCGVEYFGPFYVKEGKNELKRYGVIFTCFTSRAVHLEIANSLDTDSFLNALRRFVCIRGSIRQLHSDRRTNFVGAESELQRSVSEMDEDRIEEFLKGQGCDYFHFKMNVPNASHMVVFGCARSER